MAQAVAAVAASCLIRDGLLRPSGPSSQQLRDRPSEGLEDSMTRAHSGIVPSAAISLTCSRLLLAFALLEAASIIPAAFLRS